MLTFCLSRQEEPSSLLAFIMLVTFTSVRITLSLWITGSKSINIFHLFITISTFINASLAIATTFTSSITSINLALQLFPVIFFSFITIAIRFDRHADITLFFSLLHQHLNDVPSKFLDCGLFCIPRTELIDWFCHLKAI
jgi:hypothetical protein